MAPPDGVLLTVDEAKDLPEIDHADDDTLVSDLILEAEAKLQAYVGRRIAAPAGATKITEYHDGDVGRLFLTHYPVTDGSVEITDTLGTKGASDDETLDTDYFRVDNERGVVYYTDSYGGRGEFNGGVRRWKVEYQGGLDQHDDWSIFHERQLKLSIRRAVTFLYEQRKPGAKVDAVGAGFRQEWELDEETGYPVDVVAVWDEYRELR